MSKEQTPIEWLKQKLWQRGAIEKKDFELLNEAMMLNEAMKKQEEQTKAKVLEALEREVINSHLQGQVIGQRQSVNVGFAKQYYETEVKPKYVKSI
jgi:hypothetical protein